MIGKMTGPIVLQHQTLPPRAFVWWGVLAFLAAFWVGMIAMVLRLL